MDTENLSPEADRSTMPISSRSISDDAEKSNGDFHLSAGEKSPEEMTVSELRKAVREDQRLLEAYRQIRRECGLTPAAQSRMEA